VAKADLPRGRVYGDQSARVGFISFGSNVGAVLEAMEQLKSRGITTKFLLLRTIYPLITEEVSDFLESVDVAFVVECNLTGQLRGLIRREVGYADKLIGINKFDGTSFRPKEITEQVVSRLNALSR